MRKQSEKGLLLISAILVAFIVSAMGVSLLTVTTAGAQRELSRDHKDKSRNIAESALGLSLNALRQATDGVDNDGDGVVDEGIVGTDFFDPGVQATIEGNLGKIGTLNWNLTNDANGNGLPDFGETGVAPISLSGGDVFSYSIFSHKDGIDNDEDGTTDEADEIGSINIYTLARFDRYTSSINYFGNFKDLYSPPPPPTWVPDSAFVTGGDLTVLGNCAVYGTEGNIHSNGYLDLGGSSSITGDATASGGGNIDPANVGGVVDTAATKVMLPNVSIANMMGMQEQAATAGMDVYTLKSDGTILKNGALVSNGGVYHGWQVDSNGAWALNGSKADLDGLFYSERDVAIGGSKDPISMTLLSEGNVTLNGNGKFTSYYDNIFLVTMKDLKLAGTPQETGDLGAIFVREQVMTEGNAFIRGTIMVADLDDSSDFVTENTISGTFDIEYNGGFSTNFPLFDPNDLYLLLDPVFCAYEEGSR